MQYILNEKEFQEFLDNKKTIESLRDANNTLVAQVSFLENERRNAEEQISQLRTLRKIAVDRRDELEHLRCIHNKKLAQQAHELLIKEAEIADLSSKLRRLEKIVSE